MIVGEVHGRVRGRKRRSQSDDARRSHGSSRSNGRATATSYTITTTLPKADRNFYVRIRGTNTQDAEPPMDVAGESPWPDLWFYSNPIFVETRRQVMASSPALRGTALRGAHYAVDACADVDIDPPADRGMMSHASR